MSLQPLSGFAFAFPFEQFKLRCLHPFILDDILDVPVAYMTVYMLRLPLNKLYTLLIRDHLDL